MNTRDYFDIALGAISVVATVTGIIISVIAIKETSQSNILSGKAVEMNLFTHKRAVEPDLQLDWFVIKYPPQMDYKDMENLFTPIDNKIHFVLRNNASGKAIIHNVSGQFQKPMRLGLPVTTESTFNLLRNGKAIYLLATGLEFTVAEQKKFDELVTKTIINSTIQVLYKDIIGTPYKVIFSPNAGGSTYLSEVEELDLSEQIGYRQYFV